MIRYSLNLELKKKKNLELSQKIHAYFGKRVFRQAVQIWLPFWCEEGILWIFMRKELLDWPGEGEVQKLEISKHS